MQLSRLYFYDENGFSSRAVLQNVNKYCGPRHFGYKISSEDHLQVVK